MKIRIEIVDGMRETELIIRCAQVDEEVQSLQRSIAERGTQTPSLVFYKDEMEYYFPMEDVLFFETSGEQVYAHTEGDSFRIKYRLYELEERLPGIFVRVAKSTIVNSRQIYSIARNLTSASLIQFRGTHKQIYVSRHYYPLLKQRMEERR